MNVDPLNLVPETPAEALQREFLAAMRELYPKGCGSRQQHVDLIRTFMMGWAAALISHGGEELLAPLRRLVQVVAHPDWKPTIDWQWWGAPAAAKIIVPGGPITDDEVQRFLEGP